MNLTSTELSSKELHYEDRLVCFFDTLGWKAQIERAGNDPKKIFALASLPRLFSRNITDLAEPSPGTHITSFSDNVIVSVPYQADIVISILQGFARLQFGAAIAGFFMRGAVTIGKLHHDEFIVFGPALNRAHQLESKEATYPRVILDPLTALAQCTADFITSDEGYTFLDPFGIQFLKHVPGTRKVSPEIASEVGRTTGISLPDISTADPLSLLGTVYANAIRERGLVSDETIQKKYDWIIDRILKSVEPCVDDAATYYWSAKRPSRIVP